MYFAIFLNFSLLQYNLCRNFHKRAHHDRYFLYQLTQQTGDSALYSCLGAHGPLTRYVKLRVARASGRGRFPRHRLQQKQRSRHTSRHVRDACAVMHVGNASRRWRGKRSQHSRRVCNTQLYVSGKRPMTYSS